MKSHSCVGLAIFVHGIFIYPYVPVCTRIYTRTLVHSVYGGNPTFPDRDYPGVIVLLSMSRDRQPNFHDAKKEVLVSYSSSKM
jgi:hypothetical protein